MFNGLNMNLGNLFLLSGARSRTISPENPTGEKGGACMAEPGAGHTLGKGWKCAPCITVPPGGTAVLVDIAGPGAITSIWFGGEIIPELQLRMYWDDSSAPAVDSPLPAFFAYAFPVDCNHVNGLFPTLTSLPVAVNPCRGLNCFWQMPFRRHAQITLENRTDRPVCTFYTVNYTLTDVPEEAAYFHAQYRESKPVEYRQPYTILNRIEGRGHYVGTALFAVLNGNNTCWVEGEPKFYIDGDTEYPTVCYTGIEDYFCGSFAFVVHGRCQTFSGPFAGMYAVSHANGMFGSVHDSFMCYRRHIADPIRFEKDLRVTVQDLGWNETTTGLQARTDDFSSVAYWYQEA